MSQIEFVNHPIRDALSAQDVAYWKMTLARIMKLGLEFEFNLPDSKTGSCKGKSFTCPCVKFSDMEHDCWKICLREASCSKEPAPIKCANFNAEECTAEKCPDCDKYQFKCISLQCSNFVAACNTCKDFTVDCGSCQYRFDPNKNPEAIRAACINEFNPSGTYGKVAPSGVHKVVKDGSLLGDRGMEVITTGRRPEYWEFFNMAKKILDNAVSRGAYENERTSIHIHGLASYYGQVKGLDSSSNTRIDELERPVPEIILANFHQLVRRYQNALTWMSLGLGDPNRMTRWERFRVSVLGIPATTEHMRKVKDRVRVESGETKYGFVNYQYSSFGKGGDLDRLHVELRVMDCLLAPSAVAAFSCLYYSLFLKAVELSRYGVMKAGDAEWQKQAMTVKEAIMNNRASWDEAKKVGRFSDTSNLRKYTDILVGESYELIAMMKHILGSIGPAYEVLEKLAEAPCAVRRCDGKSWEQIEEELQVVMTEEGATEHELNKIITIREVQNAKDVQDWAARVAAILKTKTDLEISQRPVDAITDRVLEIFEMKSSEGEMLWANKIGAVITV